MTPRQLRARHAILLVALALLAVALVVRVSEASAPVERGDARAATRIEVGSLAKIGPCVRRAEQRVDCLVRTAELTENETWRRCEAWAVARRVGWSEGSYVKARVRAPHDCEIGS